MITDQTGTPQRINLRLLCQTFGFVVRKEWANLAFIAILLNILPSILLDWLTIDPKLRTDGPSWPYSLGVIFDLLCNSAFSVFIVRTCLPTSEDLSSTSGRSIALVYARFLLFSALVGTFGIAETSISLFDHALAHTVAGIIWIPNASLRIMAVALFGLFLPTLFEGVTFGLGLRKSYAYLTGYRFMVTVAYVLICILDFVPLPIIEFLHAPLLVNLPSDKYNLMTLDVAAKAVSVVFETSWLVILTSFYMVIRNQSHDRQTITSLFD